MKRIALALMAAMCMFAWPAAHGQALGRKNGAAAVFSVTPLQDSFIPGQAVQLQLQLRNTGQTALIVDGSLTLGASVHPVVTGPQGKPLDWAASFVHGQPAFQSLAPGNALTRVVCLNCGIRDPFRNPFQQPGTYTARLEYSASAAAAQAGNFPNAVPLENTVAAVPFHFQISQPRITFSAHPTQPVFHVGEPVTFNFQLRNETKQSVLSAYDLGLNNAVRLRVLDQNGNEVPWRGQTSNPTPMLSTVAAGQSIDANYAITPTNLFGTIVAGCDIQKPGTYTAYAVYMVPETFSVLQAYVGVLPILIVPGPIPAPPVKFRVEAAGTSSSNAR